MILNMNRIIYRSQIFYICFILQLFLITTVTCFKRSDVYIAGFFPYGEGVENSATGRGVMPSVKLALDHVNEHQTILRNYRLHMWWNDTECNAAVGVKSFFDMMHSGPHKLMLFGATCTHVTDPIAKASKHWHLTQLSYADTHPMFTKDAFPNFFRVVPSENAFNGPRLALLKEFNWTRVGTIYQNEPRYSLPHNGMVADLDSMELEVVETQSFVNDVSESLKKLREKDVRIILGNFNEYWARKVFCEAYRLDMYGRSFQWLIMGTYSVDWWNTTIDTDCTVEELTTAMEATIMTDLLPLSTTGDITISGITADEYLAEYDSRRGAEYSRFHGYTYDGIWAAALAIQYVSQRKEQFLTQFEYRVKDWENIFLEALKNTSFEGVTGPVRFYNNERKANILIKQFQNGQEEKIGEYNSVYGRLDLTLGKSVKWVGRSPPKDRTLIHIEHGQINITIYVVSASCSVVGIIIALIFLAFNIKYRNQRYIKMSSPHLNNLIIVGCMLTYLSIIFLGLDTTLSSIAAFPYICTARVWLLMAGFSLAFGAMFSKTWRVHSIFTDLKLNKKVIKDYQLFMVVGILLAIDIIIITTWQIADPFYRATKRMEPKHHENMEDILVIPENEYCQSEHITIFVGIIYAYKGLLLIFGAFLAWETRHVSIPALNDSKHIGFSVYNVFITCLAGAAISLVLADRKDLVFVLLSFFIIFCTTATLCLVFVPKLVELKRNPQGAVDKRIRATLRPMSKNRRDSSVCELEQRLKDVKTTNCRFRKALMEKEAELQALIRKLGPEARKWLEGGCTGVGGGITNTYENDPLLNDMSRLSAPSVRRDMPSATEVTELTSVDSVTSTHAEMDTTNSVTSSTAAIQAKNKFQTVTQLQENLTNVLPQQQQITQPQHLQITNPTPITQLKSDENVLHHRNVEKRNSVSAQTDPPPQIPNAITKKIVDCNIIGKSDETMIRDRRQSSTEHRESKKRVQENGSQTSTTPQSKHNTVHRNSTTNLQNSSNIDINNICPHTKNNNNNNTTNINNNNHNINNNNNNNTKVTTADGRKMSVHAMSSGKGNFVVSQSDLWDTHTLSHAKQHSRQSPRNHPNPQQRCEHSHIIPYDTNTTSPIQRSVSEKNRGKHRHKPQKGTVCQSETDSEREQREPPTPPPSSTTQARAKLAKSIQQHAHHHSSPNVAPDKRKLRTKTESSMYNACSESELVGDTAILPIFRKLLTEKQQPRQKGRTVVGQSCPNISIKCDIVEYL